MISLRIQVLLYCTHLKVLFDLLILVPILWHLNEALHSFIATVVLKPLMHIRTLVFINIYDVCMTDHNYSIARNF